jgi:sugar lactone lactonase YvrE
VKLTSSPFQVQTIFNTSSGAGMAVVQPDGRILYTMPSAGQLGRFDPTTHSNEILVSGFGEPRELTMEPAGTSVLVSDHGGQMIYRINLVNCPPSPGVQCSTTVLVNGPAEGVYNPEGITYDAAGDLYAVFQQRSVRQIDPVSGAILNSYIFTVNNHLEGLTYDASTTSLWAAARDVNGLYRLPLDLSSATPIQQANTGTCQLATGCIPTANGVTSDGAGTLYIAAQGNYYLYQYTITSDSLVQKNYIDGIWGVATGFATKPLAVLTATPLRGTSANTDSNLNPYTIPVVTVFDHSMADTTGVYKIYGCDGRVAAFTGESGTGVASPCTHHGYPNADDTAFGITGHYVGDNSDGTNRTRILNYEGHPGFDYGAGCQLDNESPPHCILGTGTNVYAVAGGTIHYPQTMVGICANAGCLHPPYQYHVLELIPDAVPYLRVYYLHLSTYGGTVNPTMPISGADPNCTTPAQTTLPLAEGTHVNAACVIAQSGNTDPSSVGPHLHFEVQRVLPYRKVTSDSNLNCTVGGVTMMCVPVDPYGSSCGVDPYFSLLQIYNVLLWKFPSYLSANALCFGALAEATSDQQYFTLTNVASTTLKISGIALGGTNPGDFTQTNSCPQSLSAGQSCQFSVTFTPTISGARAATLTIKGNDGRNVNLVLTLSGSGA